MRRRGNEKERISVQMFQRGEKSYRQLEFKNKNLYSYIVCYIVIIIINTIDLYCETSKLLNNLSLSIIIYHCYRVVGVDGDGDVVVVVVVDKASLRTFCFCARLSMWKGGREEGA